MAHDRHILPSNYPPHQLLLDNTRPRQALTDSTGNAQYHTLASSGVGLYHDQKGMQSGVELAPPRFPLPILPSQPAQPPLATPLELRRAHTRNQRQRRSRNPIIESSHYQAYRARQVKDSADDQKWPSDLEDSFLDALLKIPKMGRRKFSLDGKPHGRNELISLYLWIAYCETLPPGQEPDRTKIRSRKQVSSHIQVLKGFMRGHPAYERLFPPNSSAKNGFEDSFKNDPTLRALAQNRLPRDPADQYDFLPTIASQPPRQRARPHYFDMYMTVLRPGIEFKDVRHIDYDGEGIYTNRVHTYSQDPFVNLPRENLESIPNWRSKFPVLAQAHLLGDDKCDIIHMEASLNLRNGKSPDKAELWGKFEVVLPGSDDRNTVWRCTQSLYKPDKLYGEADRDPAFENVSVMLAPGRYEQDVGAVLRVTFPATPWAFALGRLCDLHADFEKSIQDGSPYPDTLSARQYIDQISMYQEIFSSAGEGHPWKKKLIVAWTFTKAKPGGKGDVSWRYLDVSPTRQACFSPHPGPRHTMSSAMVENFNAWSEPSQLQLQTAPPFDQMIHGLATPPHTGSLQSSFPSYGYGDPHQPHHDLAAENLSFISHDTQDSESTLVDHQSHNNMSNFLNSASVNLNDFDHTSSMWAPPHAESFDADSSFLTNYNHVPTNTGPQVWQTSDMKHQPWNGDVDTSFSYDSHLGQRIK